MENGSGGDAALLRALNQDKPLTDALVSALERRRRYDKREGPEATAGARAREVLSAALHCAQVIVGENAMAEAYGEDPPADASREDMLLAVWWRLTSISHVYGFAEDHSSPTSLAALGNEIMAIRGGDAAELLAEFPRQQKRALNGWRLAQRKMAALEWEAFLRTHKKKEPGEAQALVCQAFGPGLVWSTIYRWAPPIIKELGQELYDRSIAAAQRGVPFYSSASQYSTDEENEEALTLDGHLYRMEHRRQLRVVK